MNRNGRTILTTDNIAVQFSASYNGNRRLLQSDDTLQVTISYNSTDDNEVLTVMEDSSSNLDETELLNELNQDADFSDLTTIEETTSLDESSVLLLIMLIILMIYLILNNKLMNLYHHKHNLHLILVQLNQY